MNGAGRYTSRAKLPDLALWQGRAASRSPASFDLEVTARCNNDCRHCYINLPPGDAAARSGEPTLEEIERWAGEAVELGAVWCQITGGEPLLRDDFEEVYLALKRRGLLLAVFTNACLVTERHVEVLRRYPPRDLEVTMYGATAATYDAVTQRPGSYKAFRRGLGRLLNAGLPVRLKAMALRTNLHELRQMGDFCRLRTRDFYRFDPLLHLRYDGDAIRNEMIRGERLSVDEIVAVECADEERLGALQARCRRVDAGAERNGSGGHVFTCGAGRTTFTIGADGRFRLCAALVDARYTCDLRQVTLIGAWREFTSSLLELHSQRREYVDRCAACKLIDLCLWCPAHACLEVGEPDMPVEAFCEIARARHDAGRDQRPGGPHA